MPRGSLRFAYTTASRPLWRTASTTGAVSEAAGAHMKLQEEAGVQGLRLASNRTPLFKQVWDEAFRRARPRLTVIAGRSRRRGRLDVVGHSRNLQFYTFSSVHRRVGIETSMVLLPQRHHVPRVVGLQNVSSQQPGPELTELEAVEVSQVIHGRLRWSGRLRADAVLGQLLEDLRAIVIHHVSKQAPALTHLSQVRIARHGTQRGENRRGSVVSERCVLCRGFHDLTGALRPAPPPRRRRTPRTRSSRPSGTRSRC